MGPPGSLNYGCYGSAKIHYRSIQTFADNGGDCDFVPCDNVTHDSCCRSINDKVEHGIAFYALALLADFSFPQNGFGRAKMLSLLSYGLAIEIIQYFLPYRSFSLLDLGADAVGLVIYGVSLPMLKHMPLLKKRWD